MRKVKYARLQTPMFIPGVGELKNVLPPDNKTIADLTMYYGTDEGGAEGLHGHAKGVDFLITPGNIIVLAFDKE